MALVSGKHPAYKLVDLCEMTGFTPRQIHEFRARGVLQAPIGRGRGSRYTDAHVDALRAIGPLAKAGVPAKRIAASVKANALPALGYPPGPESVLTERWTRVRIAHRIEIGVVAGGSEEQKNREILDHLVRETKRLLEAGEGK